MFSHIANYPYLYTQLIIVVVVVVMGMWKKGDVFFDKRGMVKKVESVCVCACVCEMIEWEREKRKVRNRLRPRANMCFLH